MAQSPQMKKLTNAIVPVAESMGYDIVRVTLTGTGKPTLQILAEDAEGKMGVEDCSRLSQAVSAIIDVEDLMTGAYFLEVSSPGIDRPLTRLRDFEKYSGFEARVELDEAVNGQKRFKGRLTGTDGDAVSMTTEEGESVILPFPSILKAKLMLTDELLKSAQQQKGQTEKQV